MKKAIENKMISVAGCLVLLAALSACGFVGQQLMDKANETRLLKPGALDLPLTGVYDTYQYKFLDKYRITHRWPTSAGACKYAKARSNNSSGGLFYEVSDIYEQDGHTWQLGDKKPYFDRYVRSVKVMNPVVYDNVTGRRIEGALEEIEAGLQPLCFYSWYLTSHSLVMRLLKRDLKTWQDQWVQLNPKGKWSEQHMAGNIWIAQKIPEQELSPRALGASGGWFESWLLPIGNSGYTISLQLGASQESLQYPDAHIRMKAAFQYLVESVKIEPL